TADLEHYSPWLYHRHPVLGSALTGTQPGFSRLFAHGFVWEDPDPNLTAPADVAGHGNTGCFNLCILNPPRFQSLKAELAEGNLVTPGGHTGHAAPVDSAILNSLGNKHPYSPPLSFFWAAVSGRTSPW